MDYKQLYEKILFEIYQLKQELKPMLTCLHLTTMSSVHVGNGFKMKQYVITVIYYCVHHI